MKERLDVILVNQGYYESREKAKRAIMAGLVYVDGAISDKPGTKIKEDSEILVKGNRCPFVGRGGLKLAKAVEVFDIDLDDKICMDVGASTGGFTDCMLQNGAKKVYSVDVGYGQLDYRLRQNKQVVNMEKCNFRYFDADSIPDKMDFTSIDVSFISLNLIFPKVYETLKPEGEVVALIKPQFEAGKEEVGKKGIIKDLKVQEKTIEKVIGYAENAGFAVKGLDYSPVTGTKGNIEFLLYLCKSDIMGYNDYRCVLSKIKDTVKSSHKELV